MRKIKKIVLFSAAFGFVLGLFFAAAALFGVNFDVRSLDLCGDPQKISKEYSQIEDLQNIYVDFINSNNICIKESSDQNIHVTYYTTDCCSKTLEDTNHQVLLYEKNDPWYDNKQYTKGFFHGAKQQGLETVIEIPINRIDINDTNAVADYIQALADRQLTVDIKTVNGNITVDNAGAETLSVQTTNGTIFASKVYACIFSAKGTNGAIQVENIYGGTLNATTGNGDVSVKNIFMDDITADTINGEIKAQNTTSSYSQMYSTNGSVTLENVETKNRLDVSTTNGAIKIINVAADSMFFNTVNGSILGNIIGDIEDYCIHSDTINGDNFLVGGNPDSVRTIEAQTVNGDINIEFTE